jgi:hypothetical protein
MKEETKKLISIKMPFLYCALAGSNFASSDEGRARHFNTRTGCYRAEKLMIFEAKRPSLKWKARPKPLFDSLRNMLCFAALPLT